MNFESDCYVFDTTGCVIIKEFILKSELDEIRDLIKHHHKSIPWKFPILHLGRIFWDILTKEYVMKFCKHFCGDHFRMDHAFGLTSNNAIQQLHGGPQSSQNSCFYLPLGCNGRSMVGQLNIGFCIEPQNKTTGGFVYVPGSHRTYDNRSGSEILRDVYNYDFNHHSLIVPELNPGDLIVFTEALVHGDTGWKNNTNYRMQLYYKMTPGFMAWRDPSQNEIYKQFAANELELRMLQPPWTGRYYEDNHLMGTSNTRRENTIC